MIQFNKLLNGSILTGLILLISCSISRRINDENYQTKITPPGTIKIKDNFYYDTHEARNLDWLEYLYWINRIYGGTKTQEYADAFPDTTVWDEMKICVNPKILWDEWSYKDYYLRHPDSRNYPVVGISQKQAIEYCKWRSDRVFELILIQHYKIKIDLDQNKDSHFTIEKYYNDEYKNIYPGEKLMYYPVFRLPNLEERELILNYADSIDIAYFKKWHLSKLYRGCKKDQIPDIYSGIIPCPKDTFNSLVTCPVNEGCYPSKLYNLRGNVSEWTSSEDIAVGGGWLDKRERILQTDTFHTKAPNAWTGFRCVCEWKKWEE